MAQYQMAQIEAARKKAVRDMRSILLLAHQQIPIGSKEDAAFGAALAAFYDQIKAIHLRMLNARKDV